MGLFGGDAHASVRVEKPDFLSMVANAAPGTISGCVFCKGTIFWNGANWNHKDDRHECRGVNCTPVWVEGETQPEEVGLTFWGKPIVKQAPVHKCTRCGKKGGAFLAQGNWHSWLGSSQCRAAVATPANPTGGA